MQLLLVTAGLDFAHRVRGHGSLPDGRGRGRGGVGEAKWPD